MNGIEISMLRVGLGENMAQCDNYYGVCTCKENNGLKSKTF